MANVPGYMNPGIGASNWYRNAGNPQGNMLAPRPQPTVTTQSPQQSNIVLAPRPQASSYETLADNPAYSVTRSGPAEASITYPSQGAGGSWGSNLMGGGQSNPGSWIMGNSAKLGAQGYNTTGDPNAAPPPGFETKYWSPEMASQYMNPYLDAIIAKGNNAIQSSAAAKGLLGSSGTLNDIGDWTANAQSNAYNDAFDKFTKDRGYMTDTAFNVRDANQRAWEAQNTENRTVYNMGYNDYVNRLGNSYTNEKAIADFGPNAAKEAASLAQMTGASVADIYNILGYLQAQGAQTSGNQGQGMFDTIIKYAPMLITALAAA